MVQYWLVYDMIYNMTLPKFIHYASMKYKYHHTQRYAGSFHFSFLPHHPDKPTPYLTCKLQDIRYGGLGWPFACRALMCLHMLMPVRPPLRNTTPDLQLNINSLLKCTAA